MSGVEPERVRTLQFLCSFFFGGTERQVVNLAHSLDPAQFEVSFGCLRRQGELLDEVTTRGIPVTEYAVNNLYNTRAWRQRLRLLRSLKQGRVSLVHTYNFYANVFAVPPAFFAGIPVVASVRHVGGTLTPLQQRAQRVICRLAHRIAVNSEAVRGWLIAEGYDERKIVVIYNGINLARFSNQPPNGRIRGELGLPAHVPLVAVLSRLIRGKGLEYFLDAAALVAARVPEARFLVVGDWAVPTDGGVFASDVAYRRELEQRAARLGLSERVAFTGFRSDVHELLSDVAVSVVPSEAEGFSNALLEAMAAGVPVVATAVGGNGEAVQDGATGLLVPPRDPMTLANAICELLENPGMADRFGAAGRDRIVRNFSMERCAEKTGRLYTDLLASAALSQRDPPLRGQGHDQVQPADTEP